MNIIVTMDRNWGVGCKGEPLVRIPADYRFFQEETKGKVVVMTEKMLESLPGGKAVGGRTNLVLAKSPNFKEPNVEAFLDIGALRERLTVYDSGDVYILGGQPLFDEFIGDCREVHATWVDYSYKSDSFFPKLTAKSGWRIAEKSDEQTYYDLEYYFIRFVRK